jgi:hypothetical protein
MRAINTIDAISSINVKPTCSFLPVSILITIR